MEKKILALLFIPTFFVSTLVLAETTVQKTSQQPLEENSIAGGFSYKNIVLKEVVSDSGQIIAIGELTNDSGKNYEATTFVMSLYDKDSKLLGSNYIILENFLNGQTKTFNTIITDTDYKTVEKYKIQLETRF